MMLKTRGGSYWWSTARSIWRPEFVEHMDKLIDECAPITEAWPWFSTVDQEGRGGDAFYEGGSVKPSSSDEADGD